MGGLGSWLKTVFLTDFGYGKIKFHVFKIESSQAGIWEISLDPNVDMLISFELLLYDPNVKYTSQVIGSDGSIYGCKRANISSLNDKPIVGSSWSDYWNLSSVLPPPAPEPTIWEENVSYHTQYGDGQAFLGRFNPIQISEFWDSNSRKFTLPVVLYIYGAGWIEYWNHIKITSGLDILIESDMMSRFKS